MIVAPLRNYSERVFFISIHSTQTCMVNNELIIERVVFLCYNIVTPVIQT